MTSIYRDSEVDRLSATLQKASAGVNICAISGPGGVGKTFLVDHVVDKLNLAGSGWLRLSADGLATQLRGDFVGTLEKRLAPISLPTTLARQRKDQFPQTRQVLELHQALSANATKQIAASSVGAESKRVAEALLKAGHVLNNAIPKSKEYLDFKAIALDVNADEDKFEEAWDLVKGLSAMATPKLPIWSRRILGSMRRDRVQNDFFQLVAEAYASDLRTLISKSKTSQSEQSSFQSLCFFIDDFEVLGRTLSWFLFGNLLPQLERVDFPVVFLIVGRDDFAASDPDWYYKYQKYIREQIRLFPFEREQAIAFLTTSGLSENGAREIFHQMGGFPFLLRLVVDERAAETNSGDTPDGWGVDFSRQFFDRTTRWMTATEIGWSKRLVYLDKVNLETLSWFYDPPEAELIQSWFERDGSIRDPRGNTFKVREIVRKQIVHYLSVRDPVEHQRTLEHIKRKRATQVADNSGAPPPE